jgi:transcription antitermination factor NusG
VETLRDNVAGAAPTRRWFALYVKSRHEKAIAGALGALGYERLVPLYIRRNKNRCVELPLFPNYVFCRPDQWLLNHLYQIPGIFSVVKQGRIPAPVDESELASVQAIVASGLTARPWPYFREGDIVRVEHGPLRGIEGHVDVVAAQLVVSITLLQRSVAVTLPWEWVAPRALA